MKLKLLAGAAVLAMMAAGSAYAEQAEGWYLGVDLGGNQRGDWKAKSSGNMPDGSPFRYDVSTEDNWAGFARLGYRYSPNWRVEFEGGYRPGDVATAVDGSLRTFRAGLTRQSALCTPSITLGSTCGGPDGTISQSSLMVNLIRDLAPESSFHPFVGLGFGAVQTNVKVLGQFSVNPAAAPVNLSINGKEIAPAAQFLAGMAWALSDRTSLDMTYRYMAVGKTTVNSTSGTTATGYVPGRFAGEMDNQTLTIGLRMALGAPVPPPPPAPEPEPYTPPPPPPAPAPEPVKPVYEAREFIVYFEHDKSFLTADAQSVVSAAADYSKAGGAARVVVVGHADTSGSAAYNVRLSERRAKVVADALAGQGVDPATLAVDWKGETSLAVATKDGVKEPLNRRSTINIGF
jgi:outer membrane protein OmpA-like peptidoglycan-associated protein/outer membrane protein W